MRDELRPFDFTHLPNNALYIYRSNQALEPNISRDFLIANNQKFVRKYKFKGSHFANKNIKNFQRSKAFGLLSISAHNQSEILKALKLRPDFIIYSPVFNSESKSAKSPKGIIKLMGITRIFKNAKIYALGGINTKTIKRLKNTNIAGIAGVSFRI